MEAEVIKRLKKEEPDEKLELLLDDVNALLKMSRSTMSERYEQWDRNNDVYRGVRPPDKEDFEAAALGEPEKMIIPMSYAQVQTLVAFQYLLMTQHPTFFVMNPTGIEDYDLRNCSEKLMDRDMRRNNWPGKLYQQLVDCARFGLGVTKHWWTHETVKVPVVAESIQGHTGFAFGSDEPTMVSATLYEGNRIVSVSPYLFYPDTRYPLSEWRRGQFAGDEREYDKKTLQDMEARGEIAGFEFVEPFTDRELTNRHGTRLDSIRKESSTKAQDRRNVCITEVQIKLSPKKYGLGADTERRTYLLWIANDKRIVRIEQMGYAHMDFTYSVAQFSPDIHQKINDSLSDVLFPMQDTVTWLFNSRMWSVRRGIDGRIVADPEGIDVDSLESNLSPVIWMRKGAPRIGVQQYIHQLQYQDTTVAHLNDAQLLMNIANVVTGINENAMGQFHGGRRSATEARAVQAGAAGRMKLQTSLIWWECMNPMGRMLLSNQRQALSFDTFERIIGSENPRLVELYDKFHEEDLARLVSSEDFFIFDSTLESEKGFVAQSLQELVGMILSNPESATLFDLDPKQIIDEIMMLRGVGELSRFSFARSQYGSPLQQMANQGAPGGAPIPPGIPVQPGV